MEVTKQQGAAARKLREIGGLIGGALEASAGTKMGFVLMTFELGKLGRLDYISNANRQDIIKVLKEFIANMEQPEGSHPPMSDKLS